MKCVNCPAEYASVCKIGNKPYTLLNGYLGCAWNTATILAHMKETTKVRTNYEHIISMTPEELAEWIEPIADCRRCKIDCKLRENGSPANCKFRWLDWLKQEVSDDPH